MGSAGPGFPRDAPQTATLSDSHPTITARLHARFATPSRISESHVRVAYPNQPRRWELRIGPAAHRADSDIRVAIRVDHPGRLRSRIGPAAGPHRIAGLSPDGHNQGLPSSEGRIAIGPAVFVISGGAESLAGAGGGAGGSCSGAHPGCQH